MDEVPEHLKRYPTRSGRDALAARLGLAIDSFSQDWEWEVAERAHFEPWLAVYRGAPLSDDERFSLMELLVQCVEEIASRASPREQVEQLTAWQAVSALLRERPRLHASTIAFWSVFGQDEPDAQFRVSVPMRRIWDQVQPALSEPGGTLERGGG